MILVTLHDLNGVLRVRVCCRCVHGKRWEQREREALNGICGDGEKGETMEKAISQQHPLYGHGVC
jgi:hypothetical protein